MTESVETFIRAEENAAINDPETYMRFAEEIDRRTKKLLELIVQIKSDGHTIKHGLYLPGYHLPAYPLDKLHEDKPQYVLVLAWQHQDSIIKRNKKYLNNGGKFIIPLPELKIVE